MGLDKVQEQQAITSAKRAVELWLKKDYESLFDYLSAAANFFRKDYVSGVWTRYPCGVACGAGELVEQEKPLEGGQWATSALYLRGISLVRRNEEWHHFDPLGTAGVITNGSASVVSNNLYDLFGVLRYEQGNAQTPWRWDGRTGDEPLTLQVDSTGYYYYPPTATGVVILSGGGTTAVQRFNRTDVWRVQLRFPKPPKLYPVCFGCLLGIPLFIPYFADCGWPWQPGWRTCINTYWDAFIDECMQDVFCKGALGGCVFVCGIDPEMGKLVKKVLKWPGSTH